MKRYDPKKIEKKWQKYWATKKTFESKTTKGKKKYVLIEFAYPSGAGLHMGHMRPYIAGDIVSKYFKMRGFNTLYPMGWDAFGLPAENYAIKNKIHPEVATRQNIANAKKQIQSWGVGFDWSREINTTDPAYYKWTQWIFLEFLKKGLAYEATGLINWCPKDKTGLANEEVVDGKCERCGSVVEQKELRQWYLKITEYADKLLDGLKKLPEWPEFVKAQQENWIGKSEGAEIEFGVENSGEKIKVFTTRPDTLFGVTYVVLAPEHSLVNKLRNSIKNYSDVQAYIEFVKSRTDIERTSEGKEKTGVNLEGIFAINPVNNERVPVWIADYVLASYGTGAVMAVPAHDERDFQFAKRHELKIKQVIADGDVPYTGEGLLINSERFDAELSENAKEKITDFVKGKWVTQYKLRDWVFSRQRYWGEPIPVIHCEKCGVVPVPEKDLPVKLPKVKDYEPTGTGESPLATIEKWVNTKCPQCKGNAKRETNTMPQWAGSSWYWLRYLDPKNKKEFSNKKIQKYWTPVDLYFGGMEHTTLHLLYSRFWNLFLYDQKLVTAKEPYLKRVPHGIILGPDGEKMSKSRGNVVNPDELVKTYGADTTRLYMEFLGPHGAQVAWNDKGIIGTRRFIDRLFNVLEFVSKKESREVTRAVHKAVKKVTEDIENFAFNTAVSAMMIALNTIYEKKEISRATFEMFIKIASPFIPHVTEELWQRLGHKKTIFAEKWPAWKESLIVSDEVSIAIQVNGKVRGNIIVAKDSTEEGVKEIALKDENIKKYLENVQIVKVIYIPNRLLSLVVKP